MTDDPRRRAVADVWRTHGDLFATGDQYADAFLAAFDVALTHQTPEPPYEPSDAEVNAAADAYLESNGKIGATVTFKDLRAALIAAHKARAEG